jgi:hypothetical protein
MAKLSHPRGEECFAEGAGRTGNVFMVGLGLTTCPSVLFLHYFFR